MGSFILFTRLQLQTVIKVYLWQFQDLGWGLFLFFSKMVRSNRGTKKSEFLGHFVTYMALKSFSKY